MIGSTSRAVARKRELTISAFTRLIFAAYFLEAGLILILAPWLEFWDRNGIAARLPFAGPYLASPFLKGAVSGVGVITACAGLVELAGVFGIGRSRAEADASPHT